MTKTSLSGGGVKYQSVTQIMLEAEAGGMSHEKLGKLYVKAIKKARKQKL